MRSSDTARLAYLFKSYYNKTASRQETEELLALLHSASDDEVTSVIRNAWDNLHVEDPFFSPEKSSEMLRNILHTAPAAANSTKEGGNSEGIIKRLFTPRKLSVAAAAILIISFGMYFFVKPATDRVAKVNPPQVLKDAPPAGNKATLTLANGETIILDKAHNGSLVRNAEFQVNKTHDGKLVYYGGTDQNEPAGKLLLNTMTTPRGGQYHIVLSDGTKVWLNAASTLKFPAIFKGNSREVHLTGEAYFEVAKNKTKPFKVKSKLAEVTVLGTHFNISAYEDESISKTTLLEGAVKITGANRSSLLKPGQQAILNSSKMQVVNDADLEMETAWKNGLFHFKDADIETVMRQAALWYDLDVTYRGEIPRKHFTGKISRNIKASEFLNMLNYTGINFSIEGKNIIVMN